VELSKDFKQTEAGVLPQDWDCSPLVGKIHIAHGFAFQGEYFTPDGDFLLTTPGHFYESGGFRDIGDKQKYYSGPIPKGYVLEKDDVIVAMTEQADGLLGSTAIIPENGKYLHNQRLGRLKPISKEISLQYLYWVFNSKYYRSKVRETAAGTKVKHTSPNKLLEIHVPIPKTKMEQEAIANALSDADVYIESLETLIAKKRLIKKGVMQELLTGKRRLHGFKKGWSKKPLGEIADVIMGQSPLSSFYNTYGAGVPLIQGNADIVDRKTIQRVYTTNITKKGFAGDILLTVRAPVGAVAKATFECCLGRGVCAIRNSEDFLYHALIAKESEWSSLSKGSTFDSVNSLEVKNFLIDYPSDKDERNLITEIISGIVLDLVKSEEKLSKVRLLKQGMMQELLTGRIRLV
jgi:type I restriction enzyme S subunit